MTIPNNQFILIYIFLFIVSPILFAQNYDLEIPNSNYKIEHVKILNNNVLKKPDRGLGTKILDWIFGKDEILFNRPFNLIATNPNSLWILDQGNGSFFHYNNSDSILMKNDERYFSSLIGICSDQQGNIYFTDSKENKIYIKKPSSEKIELFGSDTLLNQPTGIAYLTADDQVWLCETGLHQLKVFDKNGSVVKIIGKRGKGIGEFNYPTFIWIDIDEKIYIVDSMNFRVQIMNKNGEIVKVFGQAGDATGFFARSKGIATDSKGHIYVVDAIYHTVQIFNTNGKFLLNFGSQGNESGEFWLPAGIYIDKDDFIYVADSYNKRIQMFKLVEKVVYEK